MFETDSTADEAMRLIIEDEEATLLKEVSEVPVCLRHARYPTWILFGKYAMPHSEHLIPFKN